MVSRLVVAPVDDSECWRLLRSAELGRVGVTISAAPVILPVFYTVLDDTIIFRTGTGTKLTAATSATVVVFEVDHFDPGTDTGWSVVMQGVAREVTDPTRLARLRSLPLRTVTDHDQGDRFVAVPATTISGRVIQAASAPNP